MGSQRHGHMDMTERLSTHTTAYQVPHHVYLLCHPYEQVLNDTYNMFKPANIRYLNGSNIWMVQKGHIQFTFGLDQMSVYFWYLPLGFQKWYWIVSLIQQSLFKSIRPVYVQIPVYEKWSDKQGVSIFLRIFLWIRSIGKWKKLG